MLVGCIEAHESIFVHIALYLPLTSVPMHNNPNLIAVTLKRFVIYLQNLAKPAFECNQYSWNGKNCKYRDIEI